MNTTEKDFENAIEHSLITNGGYIKDGGKGFSPLLGIDTVMLLRFIKTSQPKQWERFEKIYGAEAERCFLDRVTRVISQRGIINVMRKGFDDRGIKFKIAYFKPETGLNKESVTLYNTNILTCVRQLHYSVKSKNSIDIVLFLNGFPLVTLELKNQFTGQDTANARLQYIKDRSPNEPIFEFRNRSIVHFAVDLFDVQMTTRIAGNDTYFLPFNQGSNGAGNVGGKGNPINPNGFVTAYLWERVLAKDSLLEILHKYVHLEVKERKNRKGDVIKTESIIFPRYHQLDVVTKLLGDVKDNGTGRSYLIQHSAGSGKSNSIAWLAHRLSGLHDHNDAQIFNSRIVVTDRKVLDSQLQDTIYQFDHVLGVVEKIDEKKHSSDLKNAINDGKKIIITTLQKFPFIFKEIESDNKRFAIIIDEAHSSQTGEAAKKLKRALADTDAILEEYARAEQETEQNIKDDEDKLIEEMASHGQHDNLSFFAFTATPKNKTLQMFGEKMPDGTYRAYHIYSMRQAIEEKFILDVLKNYMTYSMYYKIIKKTAQDPEVPSSKGMKAITRFESLHPHNISQKTAIMIEHFLAVTSHKINGRAKAMVVTASRLHAVRYLFEFRRYIEEHKLTHLDVLVAFSGTITDDEVDYTEETLNKTKDGSHIKENQLKSVFNTDEFNVLIVAEKYQTGFDEPLLHTMFVDKKLSSVKAVQTLSRLNRICADKEDTFVLDFVNTAEDMKASFQPFYEATVLEEETNPNVVYDIKQRLDDYLIYQPNEVVSLSDIFYAQVKQGIEDFGKLSVFLKPAVDRYAAKDAEEKLDFSSTLASFIRIYSFITQVCRMFDKDLHKFFVYAKFLQKALPKGNGDNVDLNGELMLEYYRLEKTSSGAIILDDTEGTVGNIKGETGAKQDKKESLSAILQKINERFGTSFTGLDKVMEQLQEDFLADGELVSFAKNNDQSTFRHVFEKEFKDIAAKRYVQNDEFFVKMFQDDNFMNYIMAEMLPQIYKKLRGKKSA